jgi:hypothetical protein
MERKSNYLVKIRELPDGRKKRVRTRDRMTKQTDKLTGCVREPAGIA